MAGRIFPPPSGGRVRRHHSLPSETAQDRWSCRCHLCVSIPVAAQRGRNGRCRDVRENRPQSYRPVYAGPATLPVCGWKDNQAAPPDQRLFIGTKSRFSAPR